MDIERQIIHSGYDRQTCWVHTRPGALGDGRSVIVTMQKLRLNDRDVFYELNDLRTEDAGKTWTGPTPHPQTLGRRPIGDGVWEGVSDFSPSWHAKSGVLLGTGHTVRYQKDTLHPHLRQRTTAYSTYDPATRSWTPWQRLVLPDEPKFYSAGAGSTQRLDLENGEILLPTYLCLMDTAVDVFDGQCVSTVMRCAFDGQTLRYLEHGTELTLSAGRGFSEPSIAFADGRYFLTLRNDHGGWVAVSRDGLHYDPPRPWTFDDGSDLGSYNTQQHWLPHGDELYLVYTRRGADNDHILRHRAPLFIAKIDLDRLCVLRDSERVLVPQRGAALGNFGVTQISEHESWVVTSEWMQAPGEDYSNCRACEKYGSDNSIFVARVRFA